MYARIYRKWENYLFKQHFRFRNILGAKESLFFMRILLERCRNAHKDAYRLSMNYGKDTQNIFRRINKNFRRYI